MNAAGNNPNVREMTDEELAAALNRMATEHVDDYCLHFDVSVSDAARAGLIQWIADTYRIHHFHRKAIQSYREGRWWLLGGGWFAGATVVYIVIDVIRPLFGG